MIGLAFAALGSSAVLAGASVHRQSGFSYERFVGGHGKAKRLSPITIGIVNQQTATNAPASEWTVGAEVAQKYLNQHTGGIDGHPVKLVLCKIATTVADAATCGQEFADDRAIDAVAAGPIDVGNTALESALASSKKPCSSASRSARSTRKIRTGSSSTATSRTSRHRWRRSPRRRCT